MARTLVAAIILLLLALPVEAAPGTAAYTRTHNGGGVDVKAIYAPPEYFASANDAKGAQRFRPGEQIVFLLTFDTHAGDLTRYDVMSNIRLRTGSEKDYAPVRWESTSNDSHHRTGALIFPATSGGRKVMAPEVTAIVLAIANLAGVPTRTLEWPLPIR